MRYSRIRRTKNQRQVAWVIIVIFLILGGVYFFMAGTFGKFISGLVSPILESKQRDDNANPRDIKDIDGHGEGDSEEGVEFKLADEGIENDTGAEPDHKGPRITENLSIDAIGFYGIQIGAFNSRENAQVAADQLKTKGGAGYVLEDNFLRVMAMMFHNEEDANAVKKQLTEQSIEAQVYELHCPGVDMEITAASEKIDGISSSFSLLKDKFGSMETVIRDLDNNKITTELAKNKVEEIRNEITDKEAQLTQYSASQTDNPVLDGLRGLFSELTVSLDQVIMKSLSDRVALSAEIKYTYIHMIVKYKSYIEEITKG
ncbi:MAG: SPOR domain-containing protein [Clostridiales bacterium]|nr:SPOR domain-containing protein [Clostridiales bacterium]